MLDVEHKNLEDSDPVKKAIESKWRHLNSLNLSPTLLKLVTMKTDIKAILNAFFIIFSSSNEEESMALLCEKNRIRRHFFRFSVKKSIFIAMVIRLNSNANMKLNVIDHLYLRIILRKIPIESRLLQRRIHDFEKNNDSKFLRSKIKNFLMSYSTFKISYKNPQVIDENYHFHPNGLIFNLAGEVFVSDPSINLSTHHNAGIHKYMVKSMEEDSFVFIKNSSGEIQKLDESTHIFLGSRCASNYWHFLIEDAARLVVFKENNLALTNPTIIIPGDATQKSAEIISRIYPQSEILRLENDTYYSGNNVLIPTSHLLLDDEPRFGVRHTFNYSKDDLHKLRNQILIDESFLKPKLGNRFYVRRKSGHRLIDGEEELIRRLLELNFAIVDLVELDFMDQAALFFRAEIVIGAAGAGWANLIFSPEGTRVLSLIGIDAAPWDMHKVIASDFGLNYQQLILDHVEGDEFFYTNYLHRDVRMTEDDIANVLTWICS